MAQEPKIGTAWIAGDGKIWPCFKRIFSERFFCFFFDLSKKNESKNFCFLRLGFSCALQAALPHNPSLASVSFKGRYYLVSVNKVDFFLKPELHQKIMLIVKYNFFGGFQWQ